MSVAERVSAERGEPLGESVGHFLSFSFHFVVIEICSTLSVNSVYAEKIVSNTKYSSF